MQRFANCRLLLVLQPHSEFMKERKAITRFMAALWLTSVFAFLVLQVNRDLHPGVQKHTSQSEEIEVAVLLQQGHNQASEDVTKNLNALSDFILPETGWVGLNSTTDSLGRFISNFSGTGLLVQLLRTSISINAP